mmetsp:Transcript_25756/g.89699  ORF Transcript_25756/g.89699 Transcript_25756/m.89699 type:complete len:144 (-) Transcript_25756:83-514(-)
MVYIDSWDDFFARAQKLQAASPLRTRLWHKYRHDDGVLVIKVTDDVQCLKFRTELASDLKNLEIITTWFLSAATGLDDAGAGGGAAAGARKHGHSHKHGHGHGKAGGAGAGTHGSRARAAKRRTGAARRRMRRDNALAKASGT